ncbi:MAG: hypothetical protein HY592_03525 [Candidatus Omnitrophica bacterium]|nr:hypothetical protein [Candidatus Omnitrophota bacterium]
MSFFSAWFLIFNLIAFTGFSVLAAEGDEVGGGPGPQPEGGSGDRPDNADPGPDRDPVPPAPNFPDPPPPSTGSPSGGAPFQPGAGDPIIPVAPMEASTQVTQDVRKTQTYGTESSIIFKSAEEVTDEKKTWGIDAKTIGQAPTSSVQQVFVGRVIAIDKIKNKVTVQDRHQKIKTLYVEPGVVPGLRKGVVVQTTFQPGSDKAENVRQVIG